MILKPKQKYRIIADIRSDVSVLCQIACISRSGYYAWQRRRGEVPKDHADYPRIHA